jgi:hypothetical protein
MNAVQDAFTAGATVVVAGERHGQLNKAEERNVWQRAGVTVLYEEELLPVAGMGAVTGVRFDSPFMTLIACANDICELVTPGSIAGWIADKNKTNRTLLVDEMVMLRDVGGMLLGWLRDELTGMAVNVKTSAKFKKAEILLSYITAIADSLKVHNEKVGLLGSLSGADRDVLPNVSALAKEMATASPLEDGSLGPLAGQPKLARSAAMHLRLAAWAQHVSTPTLWKVGENHIDDIVGLTQGQQPLATARIMHLDEYLNAFRELLSEKRFQDTQQFFAAQQSLDPLMEYMYRKGWVRLIGH